MVVSHALTLNLPIQPSLSVAPKLPVSLSSHEKCGKFWIMSTPLFYGDAPLPLINGGDKFPYGTLYKSTNLMKLELETQSDADADTAADTQCVFTLEEIILVIKKKRKA